MRSSVAIVFAGLVLASPAHADDAPMDGKVLRARESRFVFRSTGLAPGPLSPDPTSGSWQLMIAELDCQGPPASQTCSSVLAPHVIELLPELWHRRNTTKGPIYRYRGGPDDPSGVRRIVLSDRRVKIRARGDDWTYVPQGQGNQLIVHLFSQDDTVCAQFAGDDIVVQEPGNVLARNAVVPASCQQFCGDDRAGGSDECDGSDDSACPGLCQSDCTCAPPVCGDGHARTPEVCDGADALACQGLCLPDCTCPPPVCGNDVVEAGEMCDPPGPIAPPLFEGCTDACQTCSNLGNCHQLGDLPCCSIPEAMSTECVVFSANESACMACAQLGEVCGNLVGAPSCCGQLVCDPALHPAAWLGACVEGP